MSSDPSTTDVQPPTSSKEILHVRIESSAGSSQSAVPADFKKERPSVPAVSPSNPQVTDSLRQVDESSDTDAVKDTSQPINTATTEATTSSSTSTSGTSKEAAPPPAPAPPRAAKAPTRGPKHHGLAGSRLPRGVIGVLVGDEEVPENMRKYKSLMTAERETGISRKKIRKACICTPNTDDAIMEGYYWRWFEPSNEVHASLPFLGENNKPAPKEGPVVAVGQRLTSRQKANARRGYVAQLATTSAAPPPSLKATTRPASSKSPAARQAADPNADLAGSRLPRMVIAVRVGGESLADMLKFESLMAAQRVMNISRKKISKACEHQPYANESIVGGYYWCWYDKNSRVHNKVALKEVPKAKPRGVAADWERGQRMSYSYSDDSATWDSNPYSNFTQYGFGTHSLPSPPPPLPAKRRKLSPSLDLSGYLGTTAAASDMLQALKGWPSAVPAPQTSTSAPPPLSFSSSSSLSSPAKHGPYAPTTAGATSSPANYGLYAPTTASATSSPANYGTTTAKPTTTAGVTTNATASSALNDLLMVCEMASELATGNSSTTTSTVEEGEDMEDEEESEDVEDAEDFQELSSAVAVDGGKQTNFGRDKWGGVIRMCGIDGCMYKSGVASHMERHRVSKHGFQANWHKSEDGKERDKWGNVLTMCMVNGCTFKGTATVMKAHKAGKHNIFPEEWKSDGKERDKWGCVLKACGIDGCTYKTGKASSMKVHQAAKHGIAVKRKKKDGKERDHLGRIIHRCQIVGCEYKTGCTGNLKKHMTSKHGFECELKNKLNDGVVRDKWGQIVRTCHIEGCSYTTGNLSHMKSHQAAKHGIGKNDGDSVPASAPASAPASVPAANLITSEE